MTPHGPSGGQRHQNVDHLVLPPLTIVAMVVILEKAAMKAMFLIQYVILAANSPILLDSADLNIL
jgi:hypothetical protein